MELLRGLAYSLVVAIVLLQLYLMQMHFAASPPKIHGEAHPHVRPPPELLEHQKLEDKKQELLKLEEKLKTQEHRILSEEDRLARREKELLALESAAAEDALVSTTTAHGRVKSTAPNDWKDTREPRVYCMVPFMWLKSHKYLHKAIMNSWGKRCHGINFFVDPPDEPSQYSDLPKGMVVVNMTRKSVFGDQSKKHIWEKMWRSWIWVADNKLTEYDWFLKVDWDNYFFPTNVAKFVKSRGWSPQDAHYFGHKIYHRQIPIIAGALEGFSRSTLAQLSQVYKAMPKGGLTDERGKCEDRKGATEELSTAICLKTVGIPAEDTQDSLGQEGVMVFQPQAHWYMMKRPPLGHSSEGWFWRGKPIGAGELETCCSVRPLAWHGFKSQSDFDRIEKFMYQNGSIDEFDRWLNQEHNAGLKQYWMDVRDLLSKPV